MFIGEDSSERNDLGLLAVLIEFNLYSWVSSGVNSLFPKRVFI